MRRDDYDEMDELDDELQDELEYEDEYEDEEYEDEDEAEGLSLKELELISTDYAEPVSEDPIEELNFLLDSYFKIQKVDPELEEEEDLKAYALDVIRAIVLEYEIPADDLAYLFKFVLTLDSHYEQHKKDVIFSEMDKEEGIKTLKLRVDEYLSECPEVFDDLEVYETLFDIEEPLTKTTLYNRTLDNFYTMLIAAASVDTFEVLLDLYVEKKEKAEKNFAAMPIPSATAEELAQAIYTLIQCHHTGSTLTKKLEEAKNLILQKYPDDALLKELLAEMETKKNNAKTAKLYKLIKFGSLGLAIIVLLIHWIPGILVCGAWGALFFSSLHDKIPFLVKGKECLNEVKTKK